MIRRRILMAVLAVGSVAGFASGFHSMHHRWHARHERFEEHVADVCVRAAKNADKQQTPATVDKSTDADW
jgi:hypothetical protein